jgi:hypothetical protein
VDAQDNVYVGGMTSSGDFPVTAGALQTVYQGDERLIDYDHPIGHGFIVKMNPAGAIVYGTFLGGSVRDAVAGIAVDSTGAVYAAGSTASGNFPITDNAPQKVNRGRGPLARSETLISAMFSSAN